MKEVKENEGKIDPRTLLEFYRKSATPDLFLGVFGREEEDKAAIGIVLVALNKAPVYDPWCMTIQEVERLWNTEALNMRIAYHEAVRRATSIERRSRFLPWRKSVELPPSLTATLLGSFASTVWELIGDGMIELIEEGYLDPLDPRQGDDAVVPTQKFFALLVNRLVERGLIP